MTISMTMMMALVLTWSRLFMTTLKSQSPSSPRVRFLMSDTRALSCQDQEKIINDKNVEERGE